MDSDIYRCQHHRAQQFTWGLYKSYLGAYLKAIQGLSRGILRLKDTHGLFRKHIRPT